MSEILCLLPQDIVQIETPQTIHQQEAVVPAKPDDGTNPAVIDTVFSEQDKSKEITPAMFYALWSAAGILGDKARSHLQRKEDKDEDDREDIDEAGHNSHPER